MAPKPSMLSKRSNQRINAEKTLVGSGQIDSRLFNYKLNEKTAKSKLVNGAKRTPLEIDKKTSCSNLNFSPGNFIFSVFPLVKDLAECFGKGTTLKLEEEDIQVTEYEKGIGNCGNHMDYKSCFKCVWNTINYAFL